MMSHKELLKISRKFFVWLNRYTSKRKHSHVQMVNRGLVGPDCYEFHKVITLKCEDGIWRDVQLTMTMEVSTHREEYSGNTLSLAQWTPEQVTEIQKKFATALSKSTGASAAMLYAKSVKHYGKVK